MIDTKGLLVGFRDLPVDTKRVKIDAIITRLEDVHPFYKDLSEFFLVYDVQINEAILDYVYDVTMRCVDAVQYGPILAQERQQISQLKKNLMI